MSYSAQEMIKFLIRTKGMTFKDAVQEVETNLHGKLPEDIIVKTKEEIDLDKLYGRK